MWQQIVTDIRRKGDDLIVSTAVIKDKINGELYLDDEADSEIPLGELPEES